MVVADTQAVRTLFAGIASAPTEVAAFAYFDPEWRLLGMRHAAPGTTDAVDLSLRDVARDAIAFDAVSVAMAHNHPSGDPTPAARTSSPRGGSPARSPRSM